VECNVSAAFVIEIDGDAAGLALAERSGFRFYAATRSYWELEGQWFRSLGQAERAATAVQRRRAAAASRAQPSRADLGRDALLDLRAEPARSPASLPDGAWGALLERYLRRDDDAQVAA
jgi:hypothetical protein